MCSRGGSGIWLPEGGNQTALRSLRISIQSLGASKNLGGSGGPSEVIPLVAKLKNVPESEQQEVLKSGGTRFDRFVQWGQTILGLGRADRWLRQRRLVPHRYGRRVGSISHKDALDIFASGNMRLTKGKRLSKLRVGSSVAVRDDVEDQEEEENPGCRRKRTHSHYEKVLDLLRKMTPTGFEHFCVRLLREHGFEGLAHQGGPGDKGIDGQGTLRINPFVSISVVFQCKRYQAKSTVRASEISEFRGSIPNSVDKGIFITSSDFTAQARSTARASDKKPIELISGRDIVRLMEERDLGLRRILRHRQAILR